VLESVGVNMRACVVCSTRSVEVTQKDFICRQVDLMKYSSYEH
jgi:hypothetical protein